MTGRRALFVLLDGVGVGPPDPDVNPFLRASLPVFRRLLGGAVPSLADPEPGTDGVRAVALDASLGVPGLPQSGTGQVALLTGANAPRLFGRHFGPWAPVCLRPLLRQGSVLAEALRRGLSVAFANAYPEGFPARRLRRAPPPTPLAAHAAGLLTRHRGHLRRGDAVASEIENDRWRRHLDPGLERVTPEEAGRRLARISRNHHLTLFAHYTTDEAGHRGGMEGAVAALERVDRFLGGVVEALAPGSLLLVGSDHGNVEDVRAGHTRNPALGLVAAPGARRLARRLRGIDDLPGLLLDWLADGADPPEA